MLLSGAAARSVQADFVSDETAVELVNAWLVDGPEHLGERLDGVVHNVVAYENNRSETLYYVVSLEPEGYVIVAADDLIEPVIAFADTGSYAPASDKGGSLYSLLDRDMSERIEEAQNLALQASVGLFTAAALPQRVRAARDKWGRLRLGHASQSGFPWKKASVSTVSITPLIQSAWSQSAAQFHNCYNYYTPNHWPSGCVATAMAQLMRFHEHPQAGIGVLTRDIEIDGTPAARQTRGGDGSGGPYVWSSMPLIPSSALYDDAYWQMIGALCYDAGICANMSYAATGSAASLYDARRAMVEDFDFANAVYTYSSDGIASAVFRTVINSNLKAGFPVIAGLDGDNGGHAVIADGLGRDSGTLYHHLNMGWGGYQDAWYNLPAVDDEVYGFTVLDSLVYNVFPENSGELVSGRVTFQDGSPAAGLTVTARRGSSTYTGSTDAQGYYGIIVPASATYSLSAGGVTLDDVAVGLSSYSACGNYTSASITIPSGAGSAINARPLLYAAMINSDNRTDLIYLDRKGRCYYTVDRTTWTRIGTATLTGLAIGDFDNDSLEEIAGITAAGYIKFADDNATDLDAGTEWIRVGTSKFTFLLAGDFDGDAVDELVGINRNGYVSYCTDSPAAWLASKDDPSATAWQTQVGTNKLQKLIAGDFNNDGIDELVGINANGYVKYCPDNSTVWRNDQDHPSSTCWQTKIGTNKFKTLLAGNFAGDAGHELVGINHNGYAKYCTDTSAQWLADQDDLSSAAWEVKIGTNKFKWLTAGNFDGTGPDELVGINHNGYAKYCSDTSAQWVADEAVPSTANWQTRIGTKTFIVPLIVGDFNGDGKDDIAGVNKAEHVLYNTDNSTGWNDATAWSRIEKP